MDKKELPNVWDTVNLKNISNKGYIKDVTGYDDNTVQAEIKTEYIPEVFETKKHQGKAYILTEAPSREMLAQYLDDAQKREVFTGSVDYDKRQDYWGPLMSIAFPYPADCVNDMVYDASYGRWF